MDETALAAAGWTQHRARGFFDLIGPVWDRPRPDGGIDMACVVDERHLNRRGVLHGGMFMTMADRAMGFSASRAAGDQEVATVQMGTQFLGPVRLGELLVVEPRLRRLTRRMAFMEADLTVGDRVVGTASGVWARLTPRPEGA